MPTEWAIKQADLVLKQGPKGLKNRIAELLDTVQAGVAEFKEKYKATYNELDQVKMELDRLRESKGA